MTVVSGELASLEFEYGSKNYGVSLKAGGAKVELKLLAGYDSKGEYKLTAFNAEVTTGSIEIKGWTKIPFTNTVGGIKAGGKIGSFGVGWSVGAGKVGFEFSAGVGGGLGIFWQPAY